MWNDHLKLKYDTSHAISPVSSNGPVQCFSTFTLPVPKETFTSGQYVKTFIGHEMFPAGNKPVPYTIFFFSFLLTFFFQKRRTSCIPEVFLVILQNHDIFAITTWQNPWGWSSAVKWLKNTGLVNTLHLSTNSQCQFVICN